MRPFHWRWALIGLFVASVALFFWYARQQAQETENSTAQDGDNRLLKDPVFLEAKSLQLKAESNPLSDQEFERVALIAQRGKNPLAQARALTTLRNYENDAQRKSKVLDACLACLKDDEYVVRIYAVNSLGRMNAKDHVSAIVPLLSNPNPKEHEAVVLTLKKLGYQLNQAAP